MVAFSPAHVSVYVNGVHRGSQTLGLVELVNSTGSEVSPCSVPGCWAWNRMAHFWRRSIHIRLFYAYRLADIFVPSSSFPCHCPPPPHGTANRDGRLSLWVVLCLLHPQGSDTYSIVGGVRAGSARVFNLTLTELDARNLAGITAPAPAVSGSGSTVTAGSTSQAQVKSKSGQSYDSQSC